MTKFLLPALLLSISCACSLSAQAQQNEDVVELPLISGWFEGQVVRYVTTDVSDQAAAVEMHANYVPRLANLLTQERQQRQPGQASAVERIYAITNFKQGSVLPSLPAPIGAANRNLSYSPIWQVHKVTWLAGKTPQLLKSEEDVLAAEEAGKVSIEKTNLIVNCPVVLSPVGGGLPHIKIRLAEPRPLLTP